MNNVVQRAKATLSRYTDAATRPDLAVLLADAVAEIERLQQQVHTVASQPDNSAAALHERGEIGIGAVLQESPEPFTFWYTNHRDVVSERRVIPIRLRYGISKYYASPTWLLVAYDLERESEREFALSGIMDEKPMFNSMSHAAMERQFLLVDELSGVLQGIARTLRHGPYSFDPKTHPGLNNKVVLSAEIGRFRDATERLLENGELMQSVVTESERRSRIRTGRYLHEQ